MTSLLPIALFPTTGVLGAGFTLARAFQRTGLDRRTADLITGGGTTELVGIVVGVVWWLPVVWG